MTLRISRELERRLRGYMRYTGTVTLCLNGENPAVLAIWLDPDPLRQSDGTDSGEGGRRLSAEGALKRVTAPPSPDAHNDGADHD